MNNWTENEKLNLLIQNGDLQGVKELIADGIDINIFDELGKTALHYAVENNAIELIELLLKSGANINAYDKSKIGNTPLGEVAHSCSYALAEMLIKSGADPAIPGWMQMTALDKAHARETPEGKKVYALLLNRVQQKPS